jgi:hypothetical protein
VEAAGTYTLIVDMTIGTAPNPAAEMFEMRRVTAGSGAVEIQRKNIAKRCSACRADGRPGLTVD